MDRNDLSRLKIDRAASGPALRPRRRWLRYGAAIVAVAGIASWLGSRYAAPVQVEAATVASAYPSQNYTLLNATGYVVPERKAALSSKATGRLEWLGVFEGSRGKAEEMIGRAGCMSRAPAARQGASPVDL